MKTTIKHHNLSIGKIIVRLRVLWEPTSLVGWNITLNQQYVTVRGMSGNREKSIVMGFGCNPLPAAYSIYNAAGLSGTN